MSSSAADLQAITRSVQDLNRTLAKLVKAVEESNEIFNEMAKAQLSATITYIENHSSTDG